MIDLENPPQPDIFKLSDFPGINADLIREKFIAGNVEYLISLFDFIQRSKHRAESLARAYFNQMEVLHRLLNVERGKESRSETKSERKQSPLQPTIRKPDSSLALEL